MNDNEAMTANNKLVADTAGVRYRLKPQYLVLGIVGLVFCFTMDILSVVVAYWNVDGSFPHPKLAALIFTIVWTPFVLLGIWLIVAFFREQYLVMPEGITKWGCVFTTTIAFADVKQVTWNRRPVGGSVIVRDNSSRIKIDFLCFTSAEQDRLIEQLRDKFAVDIQENWTAFTASRRRRTVVVRMPTTRGHLSNLIFYGLPWLLYASSWMLQSENQAVDGARVGCIIGALLWSSVVFGVSAVDLARHRRTASIGVAVLTLVLPVLCWWRLFHWFER